MPRAGAGASAGALVVLAAPAALTALVAPVAPAGAATSVAAAVCAGEDPVDGGAPVSASVDDDPAGGAVGVEPLAVP
jgi:hypothetical protein